MTTKLESAPRPSFRLRRSTLLGIICVAIAAQISMAGEPPRAGWRKFWLYGQVLEGPTANEMVLLHASSTFEELERYQSGVVGYAPIAELPRLREAAANLRIRVVEHDEYDIVDLGAGSVDTRYPIAVDRRGRSPANYQPDEYGLYVVEFHAPLKPDWLQGLSSSGAVLVAPTPNAWIIGATPAIATRLAELRYIQWLQPLHPFLKAAPPVRHGLTIQSVLVEFANIPGSEAAVQRFERSCREVKFVERQNEGSTRLYGVASGAEVERVLQDPSVLFIEEFAEPVYPAEIPALSASVLAFVAACIAAIGIAALRVDQIRDHSQPIAGVCRIRGR